MIRRRRNGEALLFPTSKLKPRPPPPEKRPKRSPRRTSFPSINFSRSSPESDKTEKIDPDEMTDPEVIEMIDPEEIESKEVTESKGRPKARSKQGSRD